MEKKVIKKGDIFEINTDAFQSDKAFYCRIGPKFPAFDIETLIHLLPSEIIPSDDYNKAFLPKTKIEKRKNKKNDNKEQKSIENNINEIRLPIEFNDLSYDSNKEE